MATVNVSAPPDPLPTHLEPLLQPTPSGIAKLLAAWDSLRTETQIAILTRLTQVPPPDYLAHKIRRKALESNIPYIRYLAYSDIHLSREDAREVEVLAIIEADPDPLVRYSHLGSESIFAWRGFLDHGPEKFFTMPHEARLAILRGLTSYGYGKEVADLISHAIANHLEAGPINELELIELLTDYLSNDRLDIYCGRQPPDGSLAYDAGRQLDALWRLVPKAPPAIADLLIGSLPEAAGLSSIPKEVLDELTDNQLEKLLWRPDIRLNNLRAGIVKTTEIGANLCSSALSSHCDMTDDRFAKILALPENEKFKEMDMLVFANDLRLCIYLALHDYLSIAPVKYSDFIALGHSTTLNDKMEKRLKQFNTKIDRKKPAWEFEETTPVNSDSQRAEELLELRTYMLARKVVPINKMRGNDGPHGELLDGDLKFLAEHVVPDDTWATFMAFKKAWRASRQNKALEGFLPRLVGIDPHVAVALDPDDQKAFLAAVEHNLTNIHQQLTDDYNMIFNRVAALEQSNSKLRGLLWTVIVLTAILLLRTF